MINTSALARLIGSAAFLSATAFAAYLPKGSAAVAGARNICLIYNSSYDAGVDYHRNWQQADFVPILAYQTTAGDLVTPMFDSVLILPLRAKSGRGFVSGFGTAPSIVDDWIWYADNRLFGGDDHLNHLDDAVKQVQNALAATDLRCKVFLTIPYPDPDQTNFGAIDGSGRSLDFTNIADRLEAIRWYISRVTAQWKAAGFHNLDLAGWYWLQEYVATADQALLPRVSGIVHSAYRKFIWIPYYRATGWSQWRDWGFDAAIYQPNYFFSTSIPITRLSDAAAGARQYGLGMELELDDRAISSTDFRPRYADYLNYGRTEGYQSDAVTAWYMGGDTLLKCSKNTDPSVRAIYDDTYRFIAEVPVPGDADRNRMVNLRDIRIALSVVGGLLPGASLSGVNVVNDSVIDIRDAVKTLRYLNGLQPTLP